MGEQCVTAHATRLAKGKMNLIATMELTTMVATWEITVPTDMVSALQSVTLCVLLLRHIVTWDLQKITVGLVITAYQKEKIVPPQRCLKLFLQNALKSQF